MYNTMCVCVCVCVCVFYNSEINKSHIKNTHTHYIDLSRKLNLEGLKTEEARKISPREPEDYIAVTVASAMNIRDEYIRPYDPAAASHGDLHQ